MWLICGILFNLNVLNLENKKLKNPPKKNSLMSSKNTLLLNMMDYEQIKFYAKMVAES